MKKRRKGRISTRAQYRLTRILQAVLLGIACLGIYQFNVKIVINSLIPLAISFLPAVLKRDPQTVMSPGIVLWITTAVVLHGLGTYSLYNAVPGYDHLTHFFSSTIVAGVGYGTIRAIEIHDERIQLPDNFAFIFIFVFTMAIGVIWEVMEFFIGVISTTIGTTSILTQFGLNDTIKDLSFNMVGATLIAVGGHLHLNGVVALIADIIGYTDEKAPE